MDIKQHIFRSLQSARQWLTRAEESFDKDKNIRAELDLMLAQAELQHVKETSRAGQWPYKYLLLRHGLALGVAVVVVSAGAGVWLFNEKMSAVPVPSQITQQSLLPDKSPQLDNSTQPKVFITAPVPEKIIVDKAVADKGADNPTTTKYTVYQGSDSQVNRSVQPPPVANEQVQVVTPDEMQKLVRAAGKTLRGH